MKLLKSRYLLITSVLVLTALIVFLTYKTSESPINNASGGITKVEVTQSAQCDAVADTFYLNFHSNMDSVAFYNELNVNPVTRNGVEIGGYKVEVHPTFNQQGCLDYVSLFNQSNANAAVVYYSKQLEVGLADALKEGPIRVEIKESQGVRSDIISENLRRLYGVPRIYRTGGHFEYIYNDEKVVRLFDTSPEKKVVNNSANNLPKYNSSNIYDYSTGKNLEIIFSSIYFYSDRYIQQQFLLEQQQQEKGNQQRAERDSLDRTIGARLK